MKGLWRANLLALGVVASSGVAAAHEVGGTRFDAPLPLPLLYAGAGATVVLTAGWLAVSDGTGGTGDERRRLGVIPAEPATALALAGRGGFLLAFVLSIAAGLLGPRVPAENVATVFVWPVWIEGVAIAAAVFGSPWRVLSPWRTLYDGLVRLEGEEVAVLGTYPSWLGGWPALVGFVALLGVVRNLTVVTRSPRWTTLVVALYAAVMLGGAVAYGRDWFDHADALAVLYRLFGRVAPVAVERGPSGERTISIRYPWTGCTDAVRDVALVGFAIAAVYTVSFDGFGSTPEYQTVLFAVRDATGLGGRTGVLLYGIGLAVFLGSFAAVARLADVAGRRNDLRGAVLAFAPTVLPIAVAYEVAHNYPYVAGSLGRLVAVVGSSVSAGPAAVDPLGWLSLSAFWASQVILIVAGHVVAVVAAHIVARRRYRSPGLASRGHVPLTALMVGYTVLSLWIVSRPVVA